MQSNVTQKNSLITFGTHGQSIYSKTILILKIFFFTLKIFLYFFFVTSSFKSFFLSFPKLSFQNSPKKPFFFCVRRCFLNQVLFHERQLILSSSSFRVFVSTFETWFSKTGFTRHLLICVCL